jgi:glucose/arabinose dehydrogenase
MDLDRRTLLTGGALGAAGVPLLCGVAEARPVVARVLAKDLVVPWGIAFLPGGDALVGGRESGYVHRVRRTGGRHVVGLVTGISTPTGGEGGLLGLAVAPTFHNDRWLYAYLTTGSDNRIVRMKYVDGRLGRKHVLLAGIPKAIHHNGGRLAFGPGGLLYASTGDALEQHRAQSRHTLNGKILRMTPSGEVPGGNPFHNRVWSYGHRNVEGITWDARGRMWATEFGEQKRDELNRIVRGNNYGWPVVEGGDGPGGRFHDPFMSWHPTSVCSPSGVAVTHDRAWVGALNGEALWAVRLDGKHRRNKARYFHSRFGRIRTVAKAPDGSLWITTSNRDGRAPAHPHDDKVIRLVLR